MGDVFPLNQSENSTENWQVLDVFKLEDKELTHRV